MVWKRKMHGSYFTGHMPNLTIHVSKNTTAWNFHASGHIIFMKWCCCCLFFSYDGTCVWNSLEEVKKKNFWKLVFPLLCLSFRIDARGKIEWMTMINFELLSLTSSNEWKSKSILGWIEEQWEQARELLYNE